MAIESSPKPAWYESDELPTAQQVSAKWVALQAATDFAALMGISFITGADPIELLTSGTAFWLIAGPAFITFGFVWRRINLTGEREGRQPIDWENDPVVKWLGGEYDIKCIRYVLAEMTSW